MRFYTQRTTSIAGSICTHVVSPANSRAPASAANVAASAAARSNDVVPRGRLAAGSFQPHLEKGLLSSAYVVG